MQRTSKKVEDGGDDVFVTIYLTTIYPKVTFDRVLEFSPTTVVGVTSI